MIALCWIISLNEKVSIWFKAIGILRIYTFFIYLAQIEQTTEIREYIGSYLDLIKLGGFIFLCAHLTGCCWFALAKYENHIGITNTWLQKDIMLYEIEKEINSVVNGYIASFYWSIITMCTVGYGDIGPTTFRERIFVVFMCLLASFLFAFSMSSIGEIIKNLRQGNEEFKQQMTALNIYMKKRRLSKQLQMRVRKYYEYLFAEQKQDNEQGHKLIAELAPNLRSDVLKEMYTNILKKQKLFRLNFSEKFISQLFLFTKEKKYSVDEYLFREKEYPESLFFILSGEVEILLQNRVILSTFSEGEFVGSQEFFGDNPYIFSAKVNTFTQFLIIDKKDFLQLLQNYQRDYESFCQMKDNINLQSDTSSLSKPCESCGQFGHTFNGCQQIKFHSNKHRQIFNYNKQQQKQRQGWGRREQSFPTLLYSKEIEESVKGFHEHIYHIQQQKDENERQLLKHQFTIEDDEEEDNESDEQQNKKNENQDINNNDIDDKERKDLQNLMQQKNQVQIDETNKNIRNIKLSNFNTQSSLFSNQGAKKQYPNDNKFNQKRNSGYAKSSMIFVKESAPVIKDQQQGHYSDEDQETYDIQSPDIADENPMKVSQKKNAINYKENKLLSCFIKYAGKVIDKSDKTSLEQIIDDDKTNQQKGQANHENKQQDQTNSQINYGGILRQKFLSKNRYIQTSHLHRSSNNHLFELTSPEKKGFLSPTASRSVSPLMQIGLFTQPLRTPSMTPKHDIRNHQRKASQFSSFIGYLVCNMYEQAVDKEKETKLYPHSTFQDVEDDFDNLKEYEIYFKHNNPSVVIEKTNKILWNNKLCQQFQKERSIRKRKKSQAKKYEKKNFNLLQKRSTYSQKNFKGGDTMKRISLKLQNKSIIEQTPDASKQEFTGLIIDDTSINKP